MHNELRINTGQHIIPCPLSLIHYTLNIPKVLFFKL
jgi:hypothetical protein